uniref:3-keto-5-aminohexanoate cleavage protein n=1 Tax=Cupriavidus yeoncheonensis TaxID=1462994 RepID=UPI003F497A2F
MHFLDDSLHPENQEKLVIQVAPYGPQYLPGDAEDIPVTMDEQVQMAVDCYNAGATVLHLHVREADGKGSKRLSMFNEMIGRLREAVPKMILQVGGSISFAPESRGETAKWLNDDTRHMLAELNPVPDQVTVAINTNQMNVMEMKTPDLLAGTHRADPVVYESYRNMIVPATPAFVEEHIRRLVNAGIQPMFMTGDVGQLETLERMIRRRVYKGPVNLCWNALGGGFDGPNPRNLMEFMNRVPDGAIASVYTLDRSNLPLTTMAIAMGLHVRCGIEDTLWGRKHERITSVRQVEKMVRIARELYRDVANGDEAREIYKLGVRYETTDETLAKNGFPPARKPGQRGFTLHD